MNENEQFREQFVRLQHEAVSSASRLRSEFLQAENRLQHQEEAVQAAGESMANKHSEEVSQMRRETVNVKLKLHQAETTVNEVVHHAERDLAAKAQAQIATDSMSGQLTHRKSEMTEFLKIHQSQSSNMSRLEHDNAELRNRLAEATATAGIASAPPNASQYTGHVTPVFHVIATPPRTGGIYVGGGGLPDG